MSGNDDTSDVSGAQELPVTSPEGGAVAEAPLTDSGEDRIADWNQRPWVLGGLLALLGLGLHLVTAGIWNTAADDVEHWRAGAAGFLFFGGITAGFTLDRGRIREAAIFAILIGLVMGGIAYNVVRLEDRIAGEEFAFAAAVFFSLLALPLFQAGFHRTRLKTDYRETHFHVWGDAICGAGALAFTGLSWLMLFLLDQLFGLVGVGVIGYLMEESWFIWMWSAGAFGAALGVLRENIRIIGTLQNVVMLVFALLAVPLAAALLIFLVLLLASGGNALWDTDVPSTPILLLCAAGSFILANAIIRDSDEARSKNVVMLSAALVLAAVILPLVVFAAIGMGMRIDQRGLSPERIWAGIAIAVAAAYGVAAWVAIARGRISGWARELRQANLNLAVLVCAVAFVLALPFWDFGAVAARNQVARLDGGKVTAQDFDFAALRWDFGDSGRAVLADLAKRSGEVALLAKEAQDQDQRPWYGYDGEREQYVGTLRMQAENPALQADVEAYLKANPWACSEYCVAVDLGDGGRGQREVALVNRYDYQRVLVGELTPEEIAAPAQATEVERVELTEQSRVELREETARYIYVDGKRMGGPVD